jgi:hypothetical protein
LILKPKHHKFKAGNPTLIKTKAANPIAQENSHHSPNLQKSPILDETKIPNCCSEEAQISMKLQREKNL